MPRPGTAPSWKSGRGRARRSASPEGRTVVKLMKTTFIFFEERPTDSPYIERIWRCHSERAGAFLSMAMSHWQMVVTRLQGSLTLTVRGPETKATSAYCPEGGEWLGILF